MSPQISSTTSPNHPQPQRTVSSSGRVSETTAVHGSSDQNLPLRNLGPAKRTSGGTVLAVRRARKTLTSRIARRTEDAQSFMLDMLWQCRAQELLAGLYLVSLLLSWRHPFIDSRSADPPTPPLIRILSQDRRVHVQFRQGGLVFDTTICLHVHPWYVPPIRAYENSKD